MCIVSVPNPRSVEEHCWACRVRDDVCRKLHLFARGSDERTTTVTPTRKSLRPRLEQLLLILPIVQSIDLSTCECECVCLLHGLLVNQFDQQEERENIEPGFVPIVVEGCIPRPPQPQHTGCVGVLLRLGLWNGAVCRFVRSFRLFFQTTK